MIASLKGYGRIARALLVALGIFLLLGIVGSLLMGVRARHAVESQVINQATSIADSSLTLAFSPSDLNAPVSAERAAELTAQVQAIVVDPSDFDGVTLYSADGTVLYSNTQSRIGNEAPTEADRIKEALKGVPQTRDTDGIYSVMVPLRFRSGVGSPAVVELTRPDTPVASAAGPWRTNALFLFAMFVLLGISVFGVARFLSVLAVSQERGPAEAVRHQTPVLPQSQTAHRPITVPQPGLREEGDARRRAEERATAAEERLGLLQDQYRKTLEELQAFQRTTREPQRGGIDPRMEERALRAEGQAQTLQQQVQTLITEREHLAAQLQELSRAPQGEAGTELRLQAAERESMGLRAQLEGTQEQLAVAQRELETAARARETAGLEPGAADVRAQGELDTAHLELLTAKGGLASMSTELQAAKREVEDTRGELRALRNEEQRAAMLQDELRAAKAELGSLQASHRADLVEREAEFEQKVRATREEFQRQLEEIEGSYRGQLGQREADLAGRIAQAESTARSAARELETARSEVEAARAEAAGREQRLLQAHDELSGHRQEFAGLQAEIKERTVAIAQAHKETDDMRRSLVSLQADLVRADEAVEAMRAELEGEHVRVSGAEDAATAADRDRRALTERVDKLTRMLEEAAAENADLNRRLQDFDARRQLELADDQGRAEIDGLLQITQERLAGQTEKLIAAEDRTKELETELTTAREHAEIVEGELRTHQMAEALREMREHEVVEQPAHEALVSEDPVPFDDRRATTPFMKELTRDAKKSLSQINGITQLLKHKKDAKDQAQLIRQLTSYAKRLDYTVSDLTEAEKLVNGTVELQIRRTDLEALVNRVVEESGTGADHDVRLVTESVKLRLDQLRTEQILAGLLRASAERTPQGKTIIVRLQHVDGGAYLSVEDPEPSSDASLSPVVKRFAEIQGGWAKVEGRDEGGSAFRVYLPDAAGASGVPADADLAPELRIVVDEPEAWDPAAGQILSDELRRLAELPAEDR